MMAPRETVSTDWQVNYPEIKMRSAHLLRSREWADCAFVFETGAGDAAPSLEAHRLILAMASPVFAAMFYGHVGDKNGPVNISDIDQPIFSAMLDYIYTDEVEITSAELASGLFRAANKYILVHLERKCINYLLDKLCPQNVCPIYELSCMFNEDELMQKCVEMFSTRTSDILKASNFKDAQVETLRKIYSLDYLNINSELDLFEALLEYTKKAQHNDDKDDLVSASGSQVKRKSCKLSPLAKANRVTNKKLKKIKGKKGQKTGDRASAEIPKECNAVRQRVATEIEQIRFLTLAPEEFAECPYLYGLLSEAEMLALSMNITSTRTVIPMPAGFSTSRMPRNQGRSEATFRFTVHTFSRLKLKQAVFSPPFYVRNLPWKIKVMSRQEQQKSLGFYLQCNRGSLSSSWSCSAICELRLLNHKPDTEPVCEAFEHVFCSKEDDFGYSRFMSWDDVLDPEKGYIKDDSITLEVHVTAEAPQGVS